MMEIKENVVEMRNDARATPVFQVEMEMEVEMER